MAYLLTPWGYEADGTVPPLISAETFSDLTGGKWDTDPRVSAAIDAASAAVRSFCGWHVAPNVACRAVVDGDGMRSVWLPTTVLTSVESVQLSASELSGIQWSRIGQVMPDQRAPIGLQTVTVDYHAGLSEVPADVAAVVAGVVVRSIALSYGVASESAGGVSVSYSQGATYGGAGNATLTDADKAALMPYKVVRSHAA